MQIRKADSRDAAFIALLARITFTETFGHLFRDKQDLANYLAHTFGVQKIRTGLKKENNVFWLAYVDGLPVGYAKLKKNAPSPFLDGNGIGQLQKIYVLKDFLAQKIGRALQDELLNYAKDSGMEKIWLSVLKSNERAIGFYQKHGFVSLGNHTFRIGKETFEFQAMYKEL
ncbi:MAG: GNAT family N-acetyltransferase [Bacteroidota bacterium]